jgi:very-short-patch-repair endonuclease
MRRLAMREGQKMDFARQLRREMADAEHFLWHHLRNRALMGRKFRRQFPVGPYITDFACIEAKLVVEIDGGQHAGLQYDRARTAVIESYGYGVLRFWNTEVLVDIEAVLSAIYMYLDLQSGPHPNPSPAGGRGA